MKRSVNSGRKGPRQQALWLRALVLGVTFFLLALLAKRFVFPSSPSAVLWLPSGLSLAFLLRDAPWWLIVLVAYAVGGVINQALLLAIHELSHNLAFRKPWHNRVFGVFINLPVGVPVSETFRYYHLRHHSHQGDERLELVLGHDLARGAQEGADALRLHRH